MFATVESQVKLCDVLQVLLLVDLVSPALLLVKRKFLTIGV